MRAWPLFLVLGLGAACLVPAAPAVIPPDAPTGLTGYFTFGKGATASQASITLSWEAPESHSYLLGGYRLFRQSEKDEAPLPLIPSAAPAKPLLQAQAAPVPSTGTAAALTGTASLKGATATATPTPTPSFTPTYTLTPVPTAAKDVSGIPLIADENYVDFTVTAGHQYKYMVQAVDAKGNSSVFSQPLTLDLTGLPDSLLAPEPPTKFTMKPGREQVNLEWAPAAARVDPISRYLLFRSAKLESLDDAVKMEVFDTKWADTPPHLKNKYIYRLKAVDTKGRVSDFSDTLSAFATGTLPPQPPMKLTAKIGAETVSLVWEAAPAGTAPVSEYLVRRKNPPSLGGQWVDLYTPRSASLTAHTDRGLEPEIPYTYEVLAVDAESNTSEPAVVTAVPQRIPFNKTGILLMPTAFSNRPDRDTGPNLNVMFSYYIGSLFETYNDPELERTKSYMLQRINIGTATMDFKYSLLPDTWLTPCLAAGIYTTTLINFSQPSSGASQSVGVSSGGSSSGGDSFRTLGGAYVVASKWLGERTAVHVGMMRGNLANDLAQRLPSTWELTIRHLMPGGDFPDLLTKLVDPGLNVPVDSSPHLFMTGVQVPFTLPLFFFKWRTGIKAEFLTPIFPQVASDKLPYMINAHMDNMPLFGFEFSYFKYFQGYEIIGFYHFRDLNW